MSTSTTSPISFTGVSTFSTDFQTILSRAKSIASLPVTALQNDQKNLIAKETEASALRTAVSNMWSSLQTIGQLGSGGSLAASSSSTTVSASATSGAVAGTYIISDITSLASSALSTTTNGYATADSTAVSSGDHKLQLVVGSEKVTLNLTADTDNLNGVRDAINASGLGVTASVIDTGSSGSARYYLSLSATATGATTLAVRTTVDDTNTNVLSVTNAGSDAQFKLNGQTVTSSENTITSAISGVTLQLNNKTTASESITVKVSADATPVTSALQSFVTAYNALATKLDAQTGYGGGTLQGDSAVIGLQSVLRQLNSYEGSGTIKRLADIGISMDVSGTMSLDTSVLETMSSGKLSQVITFLGDSNAGFASLASDFYQYSDPLNGILTRQITSYTDADTRITAQVDALNARIATQQAALTAKLQAADTLLASLESQKTMLTATIDSLNMVTNGKKSSS